MPRRRMIHEYLIWDEEFNALSVEAQNIFIRMLAKSDDCGAVPASESALPALINPPPLLRSNLPIYVQEIVAKKLGNLINHKGKIYFIFKRESFLRIQSYIINKRKWSEYLNISAEEFDKTDWSSNESQLKANEAQLPSNDSQLKAVEPQLAKPVKDDNTDLQLAEHLLTSIRQHSPKFKEPNLRSWAKVLSLMRMRDGRQADEILAVINWATNDEFWRGNILSASKLRTQFDQLCIKMKGQLGRHKRTDNEQRNCNRCGEAMKQDEKGRWFCPSCVAHAAARRGGTHGIGELLQKVTPRGGSL